MISLLTALILSHGPGVEAIHCDAEPGKWICKAACWSGKGRDGGAVPTIIYTEKPSAKEAEDDLWRQQRNGCRP